MLTFSINSRIHDYSHLRGVHGLFSHPSHYRVLPESPFSADSKARNLTLPDHLINRGWVNSEQVANFFYRQDFAIACHTIMTPFLFKIVGKECLSARAIVVLRGSSWFVRHLTSASLPLGLVRGRESDAAGRVFPEPGPLPR